MSKLLPVPLFIGGEWSTVSGVATTPVHNPSIGEIIAETPLCGADVVDQAVRAAADAFKTWSETPPVERARILMKLKVMDPDLYEQVRAQLAMTTGLGSMPMPQVQNTVGSRP